MILPKVLSRGIFVLGSVLKSNPYNFMKKNGFWAVK